jgi:hypothetical protein
VRALLRDIADERTEIENITKGLDPVEIIRLVEEAGTIAKVSITVAAVTPGAGVLEDSSLTSYLIVMNTKGSFDGVYHLIELLETLPIPSGLEYVRVDKKEKTWEAEIHIRVFTQEKV